MPRAKTTEEFQQELKDRYNNKYSLVGEYVKGGVKAQFHCNAGLGHEDWYETPTHVLGGRVCPKCLGKNIQRTQEQFLEDLKKEHGTSITTSDKFTKVNDRMWFHCNKGLGHPDWYAFPSNILRGWGCPKCGASRRAGIKTWSQSEFIEALRQVAGSTIKVTGKYTKSINRIQVCCTLCGHVWNPKANELLQGRGCPNCTSSSGEQVIRAILEFNNIDYDPQHNFEIKGKTHRLDFVLRDSNNNWCVIQPDGSQHTWLTMQFSGDKEKAEQAFKDRVARDRDENKYLMAQGVRVLRIPWFWFDLDNTFTLLQDFLGYKLEKPDKDYIPGYKQIREIAYDYLKHGNAKAIAKKYKIARTTVDNMFIKYFDMNRREYVRLHPEYYVPRSQNPGCFKSSKVRSIDKENNRKVYPSIAEASRQVGTSSAGISKCINGKQKTAGGYKWEKI